MRRFDEDGLLDRMAERGALTPELMAALGARVAALSTTAWRRSARLRPARRLSPLGGGRHPPDARAGRPARSADQRGAGRGDARGARSRISSWWRAASAAGAVRRCHGDLHLRNIVLIDGKPVPFDAIEFSERIANIDVLYDLAFALMDLCERGLRPLANRLLNEWLWRIAELPRRRTRRRWRCCRMFLSRRACDPRLRRCRGRGAWRRRTRRAPAPTSAWRSIFLQTGAAAAGGDRRPVGQRQDHAGAEAARRRSAARRAPSWCAATSSASGRPAIALEERMPAGSYTPDASAKVYAAFMARAERVLRAGHSVVLDAVFAREDERAAAEALALKVGVPFEGIWLDVPKEVAQARVAARKADASDATPAVVERQFGYDLGAITWQRRRLDLRPEVSNHSFHGDGTDRRPARRWSASPCQAAPRAGTGPAGGLPGLAALRRPAGAAGRSPGALVAAPLGIAPGRGNRRHCPDPGPARASGCCTAPMPSAARRWPMKAADGPVLRRTLDWPFPGLGRLVEVTRQRGAAGDFLNVTWPGFAGVLTAVAPGRFAASINQAPMRRRTSSGLAAVARLRAERPRGLLAPAAGRRPSICLRIAFETCARRSTRPAAVSRRRRLRGRCCSSSPAARPASVC